MLSINEICPATVTSRIRHRKIKPRPGDVSNFSDKGKFPTVNIIEAKKGRNFYRKLYLTLSPLKLFA